MVDGRFISLFRFSFRQFWTPCTSTNHEFTSWGRTIPINIPTVILRLSHFPRQLLLEWRLIKMKRFVLNSLLMITFLACVEYQILILLFKWFCVREIWFSLRGSFEYLCFFQESFLSFVVESISIHRKSIHASFSFAETKKSSIRPPKF